MRNILIGAAALILTSAPVVLAGPRTYDVPEATAQLRPAPPGQETGFEAAQANCQSCHSVDYIAMQPPKKGKAFWESEVTKMIKVYRAQIDEADGKAISAYLAEAY